MFINTLHPHFRLACRIQLDKQTSCDNGRICPDRNLQVFTKSSSFHCQFAICSFWPFSWAPCGFACASIKYTSRLEKKRNENCSDWRHHEFNTFFFLFLHTNTNSARDVSSFDQLIARPFKFWFDGVIHSLLLYSCLYLYVEIVRRARISHVQSSHSPHSHANAEPTKIE